MFCDWEQNSFWLINSTKSIELSLGKCHREAIQHVKVEPKEKFQMDGLWQVLRGQGNEMNFYCINHKSFQM